MLRDSVSAVLLTQAGGSGEREVYGRAWECSVGAGLQGIRLFDVQHSKQTMHQIIPASNVSTTCVREYLHGVACHSCRQIGQLCTLIYTPSLHVIAKYCKGGKRIYMRLTPS